MTDDEALILATDIFERAPFVQQLGVRVTGAGVGWVETALQLAPWMAQQDGVAHAGVGTTLADHTMGAAAYTMMAPGQTPLSVEITTRLLRSSDGVSLRCRARVLKPGRRVTATEADVWSVAPDGTENHVMRANATMAVVSQETT